MRLNEDQKKISNPRFDVIVCAGAGTGKTTVLATRFLRYIDESTAKNTRELAEKCCAITFTEKAANEMRERVFEYAFAKFKQTGERRWFDIYRSIEFAPISTIHSFCRSLITQDPLRAGIEPNFDVEPEKIPVEKYTEQFLSYLIENNPQINDKILWMIRKIGRKNLKLCLIQMFENRQYIGNAISELAAVEQDALKAEYSDFVDNQIRTIATPIYEQLKDFANSAEKNLINSELLAKIEKVLLESEPDAEFLEKISNTLKGQRIPKAAKLIEVRSKLKKIKFIDMDLDNDELAEIAHLSVEMAELYVEFERYIWLGYELESTVDFNAMLILALQLIEKMSAKQAQKIYPIHLLVDEFQDTSPMQWKIISKVADYCSSVMFVGDEKQSIYRFRGADVSVIKKGEKYISRRNVDNSKKVFSMNKNYRTSKRLLGNFNKIFRNSFPEKTMFDFEARFQELEPDENADSDGILWIINPDILDEHCNPVVVEQEHIVGDIIQLSFDKGIPNGTKRKYSDFLVLATSKNKVFNIVWHLRKLGIPAIPLVNAGFYSAPEIIILRSLVDFLADTRRNGALFSLLTHPIFNIRMNNIYEVLGTETDINLWNRLKSFYEGYDKNKNYSDYEIRLMDSFERLSNLLDRTGYESTSSILENFLSDENVLAKILDETSDFQFANICKFLEHIHELESSGLDIAEISENLRSEKDADEVGFATPTETVDVVRVSTIHSAKGLEANIVIVCDRGSRRNDWSSNTKFYAEPEIPYMFVPKMPENDNLFFTLLKQIVSLKNNAESERLFYVALTRAKEHLFIVPTKNGGDFFSKTISALRGKFDKKNKKIKWEENIPDGIKILNASEIWYPENEKIISYNIKPRPIKDYSGEKIVSKRISISATDAASFFTCPQYYKLKAENLKCEYSRVEYKEFPPDKFGNIVHKILSTLPNDRRKISQMAGGLCDDRKVRESVIKTVERFLDSDFFKNITDDIMTEVPLWLSINDVRFKGFIDAMTKNMIWDYKTGKRNSFNEIEYFYQLNIYRLAIAKYRDIEPQNISAKIIWLSPDSMNIQNVEWDDKIFQNIEILKNNFTDEKKCESLSTNRDIDICDYCPMKEYCEIF